MCVRLSVCVCVQVFFNLASATRWSDCSWDEACAEVRVGAHAVCVRVCMECVCGVCVVGVDEREYRVDERVDECVYGACGVCGVCGVCVWTSVCRGHHGLKDAAPRSLSSACVPC